jgi:hypothetical protein
MTARSRDTPDLAVHFSSYLAARRMAVLDELDGAWDGEPLASERLRPYLVLAEERGVPLGVFSGVAPPGTSLRFARYRLSLGRPLARCTFAH